MNRGHLKIKMLKGEILARLGHSYGYDDATYDVEFNPKRKFRPVKLWKTHEEMHKNATWDGEKPAKFLNLTEWDLGTSSGWLSKEADKKGFKTLGVHSNLSYEIVEKKMLAKLKRQGLA